MSYRHNWVVGISIFNATRKSDSSYRIILKDDAGYCDNMKTAHSFPSVTVRRCLLCAIAFKCTLGLFTHHTQYPPEPKRKRKKEREKERQNGKSKTEKRSKTRKKEVSIYKYPHHWPLIAWLPPKRPELLNGLHDAVHNVGMFLCQILL